MKFSKDFLILSYPLSETTRRPNNLLVGTIKTQIKNLVNISGITLEHQSEKLKFGV